MQFTAGVMNLGPVEDVEGCAPSSLPVGSWAFGVVMRGDEKVTLPPVRLGTKERARDVALAMARHVARALNTGAAAEEWTKAVSARAAANDSLRGSDDLVRVVATERAWQEAQLLLLRAVGPMSSQ